MIRQRTLLLLFAVAATAAPAERANIQYWDLPTGSHIAYLHYPAAGPRKPYPIVFLHGGPGAFLVDHPAVADRFYQSLAALGFDVYLYDQIGSGRSARLADPRQYTVDRHIRDLDAIRERLRVERMILVGDSWGATLGANYIAQHPARCVKAIFSGPGALDHTDLATATNPDAPMVKAAEAFFASLYSQPRYRAMADIRSADVLAVYRSFPDREMDPQLDAFVQRTAPYLVCDPARLPPDAVAHTGMGWWVNLMTSVDFAQRRSDPKRALAQARMPVLILRGGCDYLRPEVAGAYKQAFPNATLLYVPDAGHAVGFDQPEIYKAAVRAFLLETAISGAGVSPRGT